MLRGSETAGEAAVAVAAAGEHAVAAAVGEHAVAAAHRPSVGVSGASLAVWMIDLETTDLDSKYTVIKCQTPPSPAAAVASRTAICVATHRLKI